MNKDKSAIKIYTTFGEVQFTPSPALGAITVKPEMVIQALREAINVLPLDSDFYSPYKFNDD
jgi:hypothetical protein